MICGDFGGAAKWRDGGFDENYSHDVPGLNYRMTNIQAAVALAQLERIETLVAARRRNAEAYASRIRGKGKWLFVAQLQDPARASAELKMIGVETRRVFTPIHRSHAFRYRTTGKYPVAEEIWRRGLVLPTGPHVTAQQVEMICEVIAKWQSQPIPM